MTCPTPRLSVERIVEIIACARICDLKSGESLGDVERRSSTIHSVFERLRLGKIDGAIAGDLAVLAYMEGRNARYLDLLLDWDDSLALNLDEVFNTYLPVMLPCDFLSDGGNNMARSLFCETTQLPDKFKRCL